MDLGTWTIAHTCRAADVSCHALPCQGKLRLDAFLAGHMPDASRAKVQSSIKGGLVLVNGKVASKASMVVKPGDMVACELLPPPPMEVRAAAGAARHVHAGMHGISNCSLQLHMLHACAVMSTLM